MCVFSNWIKNIIIIIKRMDLIIFFIKNYFLIKFGIWFNFKEWLIVKFDLNVCLWKVGIVIKVFVCICYILNKGYGKKSEYWCNENL